MRIGGGRIEKGVINSDGRRFDGVVNIYYR